MLTGTIRPFKHNGSIHFTSHSRDLGGQVLADWFGNDVVSKKELMRIIHAINSASKAPEAAGWIWGGNAHNVFVSGESIYIENEYVDAHRVFMTRTQLLTALETFRSFFVNERRDEFFEPIAIEVNFEAEGKMAEKKYQELTGT